jgi:ribosome-associated translation inhibitor RaiA
VSRRQSPATVDIRVATDERVPAGVVDYARDKIGTLLHLAPAPVLSARVQISRHGDPAVQHRVVAQANLDVNGRLVRAQAEGDSTEEAIDRLQARLRTRLDRVGENWEHRRGGMPSIEPHEWRHQSEPTHRHRWYPRPEDEREILRRKSFTLHRSTIDDAAWDMDLLDYDFYLFTESGTGQDSVLYRAGATGYRLAQLTPPRTGDLAPHRIPLTIRTQPAPALTTEGAVERLNLLDLPFLFFLDAGHHRGAVLYHRYDGHYGLILAAD